MAFAQHPEDNKFRLNFCTTIYGLDYCFEHDAIMAFHFSGDQIKVNRFYTGSNFITLKSLGPWKLNSKTGEQTMNVLFDDDKWALTKRENSYLLTTSCNVMEFWQGSRDDLRENHRYIDVDEDDFLNFADHCELLTNKRSRKWKMKNDTDKLIMGRL